MALFTKLKGKFLRGVKRKNKASPRTSPNTRDISQPIPSEPFPFLSLPRELRDHIYHILLSRHEHGEIWIRYSVNRDCWWDATRYCKCHQRRGHNPPPEPLTLGLLKVNKQVHAEAIEALYGINRIWVDAPPTKSLEFLSGLAAAARERIQYLKLWLDYYIIEKAEFSRLSFMQIPDSDKARTLEEELVLPWKCLLSFMAEKLPLLHTLCITRQSQIPFSKWGPIHPAPRWAHFFHQGWAEAVRDIPSLTDLHVEIRVHFEGPHPSILDGCNELRQVYDRNSGFRERSVEWIHTFFEAGGDDASVWPEALLMVRLSRSRARDENALPLPSGESEDEDEGDGERVLPPLPEFVQKHTYADAVCMVSCTMGLGIPPRSPDNNR